MYNNIITVAVSHCLIFCCITAADFAFFVVACFKNYSFFHDLFFYICLYLNVELLHIFRCIAKVIYIGEHTAHCQCHTFTKQ